MVYAWSEIVIKPSETAQRIKTTALQNLGVAEPRRFKTTELQNNSIAKPRRFKTTELQNNSIAKPWRFKTTELQNNSIAKPWRTQHGSPGPYSWGWRTRRYKSQHLGERHPAFYTSTGHISVPEGFAESFAGSSQRVSQKVLRIVRTGLPEELQRSCKKPQRSSRGTLAVGSGSGHSQWQSAAAIRSGSPQWQSAAAVAIRSGSPQRQFAVATQSCSPKLQFMQISGHITNRNALIIKYIDFISVANATILSGWPHLQNPPI